MSKGERAQSIKMQKVSPFEVAAAIEQAGRGHIPDIDGPKAEREDGAVCVQATSGEPGGIYHWSHEPAHDSRLSITDVAIGSPKLWCHITSGHQQERQNEGKKQDQK